MKKGTKIHKVNISKEGYVSATDENGFEIKLSHSERNALKDIKIKNKQVYVENIIKAFGGNPNVLSSEFTVYKNGEMRFTYTKNKND